MNSTKTYHIQTFGCQMNERDSETLAGMLTELGYTENGIRDEADIIIINTCSVREHADERFFGTLGQLKKVKERRPETIICLCGCMMQQQHITDRVKSKFPWVDLIFGTNNIHEFPALISAMASQKEMRRGQLIEVRADGGEIVEGLPSKRKYPFKSFVNITFGCNNFCTYCIVPYTRGRERSRRPADIIRETESLAADGVKEVTLLGQNVNSYAGEGGVSFPDLLAMINRIDGIERIRFMTSHPKDLSPGLIRAFAELEKLCGHIHLPVQSGSDRVLRMMNRRYTSEQYLSLIGQLRAVRPDIAVTTDIIVGFPGETEEDLEQTLELCRRARFDSAFTFIYSVRKGTPAEKFPDQVPEEVKHERFGRLVEVVDHVSAEKNAAMEGRVCKVLVEGESKNGTGCLRGRTDGFKLVDFEGDRDLIGSIVDVGITRGRTFSLTGRLVP